MIDYSNQISRKLTRWTFTKSGCKKGEQENTYQNSSFWIWFPGKTNTWWNGKKTFIVPYLHNRDKYSLESIYYPSWKYLCTVVSFSEACFLIEILQQIKVSPFKLKTIFYENDTLPIRNPIFSRYNDQKIDAIIIDDTR